ncbi:ATP-binding protein [Streptomyces sp. NBC_00289]|uniref:hypothetical protein n=1 Tax=Streptomyces sp. NBC_00289 TaxID=2975703 RepID=UPI003248362A
MSTYLHHAPLPEAEHEAEAIVTLLAEHLNGVLAPWTENGHRTETSIKLQLNTWAERGDSNSVLIWLGHGTSNGFDAWLATYETPSSISYSGVNPQTIAEQINKQWQRRHAHQSLWLLLVIEACGAATFVRKLAAALLHMVNAPERFALIGVGGDDSATPLGQFRRALASALNSYTDNDEQIAVAELVSNLRNRIAPNEVIERGLHVVEPIRRRRLLPSGVTAPLDVYAELRAFLGGLSHDERGHFLPKAQGAEHGELVWYFVGRHTERERVASWIRDHDCGMLIVTGRAGAGKSALLGNVLVQSNAALCDLLARAGYLEPTPSQAAVRPFDAVVHLTGITTGDLVLRLAAAAGLPPPRRAETSGSVDWLVSRLRDRAVSFLVLADALDEAQEPGVIAGSVLRSIAALPHVKVVVGTRASTLEGPDQPDTADEDLLDALGRAPTTQILTVDRDPAAVATYAHLRLMAARAAQHLDATDNTVASLSALIGEKARQFLFARLVVHEIVARPDLLRPERRGDLVALLETDHQTLFSVAINRLTETHPAFAPLLEALAMAPGRGIPRSDRIWVIMANAIAAPGVRVTEADIDALLVAAAPYIMLDSEDGQSVYRLAHRTFQEAFHTLGPF